MRKTRASLTDAQVRDARQRYRHRFKSPMCTQICTQVQLAKELGITQAAISNMLNGKTYKDVK
jgi:hypothetical protein